jgi:hypothetical protein
MSKSVGPRARKTSSPEGSELGTSAETQTVCFDVETAYQQEFKYGPYRDYDTAWDIVAALKPTFISATAYVVESNEWQSFRPADLPKLARFVAKADRVITFNGKCWDVPVIGMGASKTTVSKLRKLSLERSPKHEDIWQISRGPELIELYHRNFGPGEPEPRPDRLQDYKSKLMDQGWEEYPAFRAGKAFIDVGMTVALWRRWKAGTLKLSSGQPPLAI